MPADKEVRVTKLGDSVKADYNFTKDRFEGVNTKLSATVCVMFFRQHGHKAGVFESEDDYWDKGKKVIYPYFKVWIMHPDDAGYYTWWRPTADNWADPVNLELATWFEFVKDEKK